jgi:hypothetical protein
VDDNICIFHPAHPISLCEPNVDNGIADTVVRLLVLGGCRFLVVCAQPGVRHYEFKSGKDLVAQGVVGLYATGLYVGSAVGVALYAFSLT